MIPPPLSASLGEARGIAVGASGAPNRRDEHGSLFECASHTTAATQRTQAHTLRCRPVASARDRLVSVIVPTRESEEFLDRCLTSIRAQSHGQIELIVVDNHSTDGTRKIAQRYADLLLLAGPERSAQVNRGAEASSGGYIYRVDSDFVLERDVVEQCLDVAQGGFDAVVVHNTPDESRGWIARVRKFEVDMYKNDLDHSAARFIRSDVYKALGGYNEQITAGEDYDFQNRLNQGGYSTGFAQAEAIHLGEPRRLLPHLRQYFAYGCDFHNYRRANPVASRRQLRFLRPVYLQNWRQFAQHPLTGLLFIAYNVLKFGSGAAGYATWKASALIRLHRADQRT